MKRGALLLGVLLICHGLTEPLIANDLNYPYTDHKASNSKAMVLNNRAIELFSKGYNATARKYFDAAVEADSGSYLIYYNRAMFFWEVRQWDAALRDLNSCLRLKPTFVGAFILRGGINDRLGNYGDALSDYNGVVRASPHDSWILDCRASLLATCPDASVRNGQAAITDATTACKMTNWGSPQFIDTLAAAYAETGDFDSAVKFEEKAIAQARKLKVYSTGMQNRLALYHEHHPYREKPGSAPRSGAKSPGLKKG